MKKIKYLLVIAVSLFFIGCTALDSLLPQKQTEEISLVNSEKNRHLFMVNYDKQYAKNVYLNNVQIEPGVPYYVSEGKYWFRFDNIERYRISVMMSGSRGNDENDFDPPEDRSYQFVKRIIMNEDKVINLEGRRCKIYFRTGKGFK